VTFIDLSPAAADRINIGGRASLAGGLRVVRASGAFTFSTTYTVLSPGTDPIAFGRLAWTCQPTTERSLDAQFQTLSNSGRAVFGARPSMHTALASAGAELRLGTGLSLTASINAEFGERHQAIRCSLGLRRTW